MTPATLLARLKPYAAEAVRHGDFLISTNALSDVWLNDLHGETARTLVRDALQGFWESYLADNPGDCLLISIEPFAEMAAEPAAASALVQEVVAAVNQPRLRFDKVFVDPDSFEVFINDHPKEIAMLLFVEPSTPHDLLLAVCRHLEDLAYTVKGVITTIERKHRSDAGIHPDLPIEFIPFFVYDEQTAALAAVTELDEEPYRRYHRYFSGIKK